MVFFLILRFYLDRLNHRETKRRWNADPSLCCSVVYIVYRDLSFIHNYWMCLYAVCTCTCNTMCVCPCTFKVFHLLNQHPRPYFYYVLQSYIPYNTCETLAKFHIFPCTFKVFQLVKLTSFSYFSAVA